MFRKYLKLSTEDSNPGNGVAEPSSPSGDRSQTSLTAPPAYSTSGQAESQARQQRSDLEDTFGEVIDENDDHAESDRLLQPRASVYPSPSSSTTPSSLPATNDGVFSNMSAKPESERVKVDEIPPAYEEAVQDATPPYWHTAIIAPSDLGDLILVEGLPVGHLFVFAWNILISATFQLAGFLFTYLLHTSHAAKNGSLAGLGVSLVQYGFYARSRGNLGFDGDDNDAGQDDSTNANIVAYFLMILGWFIIIRSVADYLRAKKMERIIATDPTQAEHMV